VTSPVACALQARGVSRTLRTAYGSVTHILQDVDLCLLPGEMVALMGPSGSGKSSLLQILGGLDNAYSGQVLALGQSLGSLTDGQRAKVRQQSFGFVFQAYNLIGHLSALDNVLLPSFFGRRRPELHARGAALLQQMGLDPTQKTPARSLSGGEQQRIAMARACLLRPPILLCDEPTGSLDADNAQRLLTLLSDSRNQGTAVLLATHDLAVAKRADRCLTLVAGRLQPSRVPNPAHDPTPTSAAGPTCS
jgi:putative ABC transport system ATP-binding protein